MSMYIYFILAEDAGVVKIGRSIDPCRRLKDMVPHCPITLDLLGSIEGPCKLERQIHTLLIDYHQRNEWFEWNDRVKGHVSALLDGSFDYTILPQDARKAWALERLAASRMAQPRAVA